MTNMPLAIISGLTAVLFLKCEWDEGKAGHKDGLILMASLAVISSACLAMSIMEVGC